MEKLYKSVNGVISEYTQEEYLQAELDQKHFDEVILPSKVRQERNKLLADSDWTQTSDNGLSAEKKQAWATYRQELRDITLQSGFPTDVVFPTKP